jgi:hypothetical protein
MRLMLVSLGAVLLSGCAGQLEDIGRAPEMTPVGYGLANRPATFTRLARSARAGSRTTTRCGAMIARISLLIRGPRKSETS